MRSVELIDGGDRVKLSFWGAHASLPLSLNERVEARGLIVGEWNNKKIYSAEDRMLMTRTMTLKQS